jgi:hypothetical protein
VPRYIVQTLDGEMEYGSLEQLRQAVEIGLVSPDALVNEEGGFHGRPAKGVVTRPGTGVKNALRTIPIPSPTATYVLGALALLAAFYVELPRLTVLFPALWKAPGISMLAQRPPDPAGWPLPIGIAETVAAVLLLAAFARALFAAAPQNAVLFSALGGYLLWTDRFTWAVQCFAAAAVAIALGVRRLRSRRAATAPSRSKATR